MNGVFLFLILFIFFIIQIEKTNSEKINVNKKITGTHECLFFDQQLFDYGVGGVNENEKIKENIKGVIVPHHLLASHIIADTFHKVLKPEIKKVIIIGPDHYEKGSTAITTSDYVWETPFQKVFPDVEIINFLAKKDYVNINSKVLENEHSISGLISFISHYSPEAQVIPLIISQRITKEEINDISEELYKLSQADSVAIVISVDFSHYLTSSEAEENDKISFKTIKDRNYEQLLTLNNDYVDSPQSLVIFLKTLDRLGINNLKVLHNTNSGRLVGDPFVENTSYFGIVFW